eukprot:3682736-Lingulodinium_polyedra.AAC.1
MRIWWLPSSTTLVCPQLLKMARAIFANTSSTSGVAAGARGDCWRMGLHKIPDSGPLEGPSWPLCPG